MNADERLLRVFVVGRSAASRSELRAILEDSGVEVVGEAATVDRLPIDARDADVVVATAEQGTRTPAERYERGAGAPASNDDDPLVETLTAREQQVLELAAEGFSNRAIAARLEISEHTVKFHLSAIYGKLGVATRAEAVLHAVRRGFITI